MYNIPMTDSKRPYFLWDYDLTEDDVRRILRGDNTVERLWLMARILTSAHYNDIWKYLSVGEIVKHFGDLKLRPRIKANWLRALTVWGYHV